MTINVILAILVTSIATYLSRILGVISAEKIKETSKMFRWFNCLAYSTLAALIARMIIFPAGDLAEVNYVLRFIVIGTSLIVFFLTNKNLVYPTIFSALFLSLLNFINIWRIICKFCRNLKKVGLVTKLQQIKPYFSVLFKPQLKQENT